MFVFNIQQVRGISIETHTEGYDFLTKQGIPVIACDIPSGIEGNTGAVLGIAVQADETVTFSCAKPGLLQGEGRHCAGKLTIADIGIPKDLLNNDT